MYNNIKFTSTLYILISIIFISQCSGPKPLVGESFIDIPCQSTDLNSNRKYFRAFGTGSSNSIQGAIMQATQIAKSQLAQNIETTINVVSEEYSKNIQSGQMGEYSAVVETISRQVANQSVQDIRVSCGKTAQNNTTGMFTHYITIEVDRDNVEQSFIAGISRETSNRIEVDRDKFRDVFNQEMDRRSQN